MILLYTGMYVIVFYSREKSVLDVVNVLNCCCSVVVVLIVVVVVVVVVVL